MTRARRTALGLTLCLAGCTSADDPAKGPPARVEAAKPAAPAPAPAKVVEAPPTPPQAPTPPAPPLREFPAGGVSGQDPAQTTTPPVRTMQLAKPAVKWSAEVGKTTFRTTMALVDGQVVIGTHGKSLDGKNEPTDGVYLLDARTGARTRLLRTPGSGDRDVGGVAIDGDTVYFTADNAQIVAVKLSGETLWTAKASGKVRPAPALADLDKDGAVDLVVGDESGTLYALAGKTGVALWTHATGTNEYGARGFIGAAAIADLDGDGKDDVVAGARDGILAAYRGATGEVLWQQSRDTGIHASPTIADFDLDGRPEVLAAWSYGDLSVHDGATGEVRWSTRLEQDRAGIEGLFGTPTPLPGQPGVIVAPTSWWGGDEDGVILVGQERRAFRSYEGRVTASAVLLDLDGDERQEAILGTEKGVLLAFTADGRRAELARLGGPVEAAAMVADVDGDGAQDLLVAANDGKLTCFSTAAKTQPQLARFRGDSPHNRGDLGKLSLGWRSGQAATLAEPQPAGRGIRLDYLQCCKDLVDAAPRAPAPDNAHLLDAASKCNGLAAAAVDRQGALATIKLAAGDLELPASCR